MTFLTSRQKNTQKQLVTNTIIRTAGASMSRDKKQFDGVRFAIVLSHRCRC